MEKTKANYLYQAFGLYISSSIRLPELLPSSGIPDVIISYGKVPDRIYDARKISSWYQAANSEFLFQVPGTGRYYVADGDTIIIEPDDQADDRDIRLFLLGTAIGVLLLQRGALPIHGSAVAIKGKCVIFTGVSGAGKSTLIATFRQHGYEVLTDDVAAVTFDVNGIPWGQPGYPQQKLWRDSAEKLGMNVEDYLQIRQSIDKYAMPMQNHFCEDALPVAAICELIPCNTAQANIIKLAGIDKSVLIMKHTYRAFLINGLGLEIAHLKQSTKMATKIRVWQLRRPIGEFSNEQQIRLILNALAE